jgi:hypothetical protein
MCMHVMRRLHRLNSVSAFTRPSRFPLFACAPAAKTAQLRLWKDYVPKTFVGEKEYDGRVAEVVSGDTLVVAVGSATAPAPEERRISLSSIRAPRLGRRDDPRGGDPWAAEAKEYLRKTLIGRDVHVVVDYTRVLPVGGAAAGGGGGGEGAEAAPGQERTFATVFLTTRKGDKVNVAAGLLGERELNGGASAVAVGRDGMCGPCRATTARSPLSRHHHYPSLP